MFEEILTLGYWTSLIILSLITMIALIIGMKIINRKPSITQSFLVSLIINILTTLGILGMFSAVFPIPYVYYIISLLVWIGLIKFFFPLHWKEAAIIGFIGFIIIFIFDFFGIYFLLSSIIKSILKI
ncbi:MAG: hypothetical protein QXY29_02725 [Candidatus Aenigmatarchaeota archaeon]